MSVLRWKVEWDGREVGFFKKKSAFEYAEKHNLRSAIVVDTWLGCQYRPTLRDLDCLDSYFVDESGQHSGISKPNLRRSSSDLSDLTVYFVDEYGRPAGKNKSKLDIDSSSL